MDNKSGTFFGTQCITKLTYRKTVLEWRLPGKKERGRPQEMLLSWLLETNEGNIDYQQLKKVAQTWARWSRWKRKPAQKRQNTTEEKLQSTTVTAYDHDVQSSSDE